MGLAFFSLFRQITSPTDPLNNNNNNNNLKYEGTCWVVSIHANTHPVKIRHLSKYPNVFGPFSSRIIQGMAQVGKTITYIA